MITNALNQATPGNRANGSFPQPRAASPVNPPNQMRDNDGDGDFRNGSFPLTQSASPVSPPNETSFRFTPATAAAEHAKMGTPSAVQPGPRAVPVNPGVGGGGGSMPPSVMKSGR